MLFRSVLTAEHKAETEDKKDKYIRRERTYGSYQRSFDLTGIDTNNIAAEYKNGILTLDLPKMQEVKPETKRLAPTDIFCYHDFFSRLLSHIFRISMASKIPATAPLVSIRTSRTCPARPGTKS